MKSGTENRTWLSLLQRWLTGDATRRDEQALNNLAKDDPFLAEAFEGYQAVPEGQHAAAVTKMKVALRSKYQKKQRGTAFYLLRAAAAVAVLVAAWWMLAQSNDTAESGAIAESVEQAPSAAAAESQAMVADSTAVVFDQATENTAPTKISPLPSKPTDTRTKALQVPPPPVALKSDDLAFEEESIAETTEKDAVADEDKVAIQSAPAAAATYNREAASAISQPARLLTGKVTDPSGNPLAKSNVEVPGTSRSAVTDAKGEFALELYPPENEVVVTNAGYMRQDLKVGQQQRLEVRMLEADQAPAAADSFVQKKESAKKKADPPKPVGGFEKFETYLKDKMVYPYAQANAVIKGPVTLEFQVLEDGTVTNVSVLGSLGPGFDEEAVRLLINGPKWEPAGRAVYTVQFGR